MSSPGIGLGATPQASLTNLVEQKLRAERVVRVGAEWFVNIAALSMINSVLSMSGKGIRFIFGLGIARLSRIGGQLANAIQTRERDWTQSPRLPFTFCLLGQH